MVMKKIIYMFLFLSLSSYTVLHAQEEGCDSVRGPYTLEECRQMALSNNSKVRNANLQYENMLDTKRSLFTKYFPNISAGGAAFTTDNSLAKFVILPGLAMPVAKDGIMGGVMAVQPVFAGGKIIAGNKLGKVGVEVEKMKVQTVERDVTAEVERYYWLLVSLKEKRTTVESAEALIDNLYGDVSNLVDAGVRTKNDLLEVMYARNDVKSKRMELENGIELSRMALAQYIGLDSLGGFDVDTLSFDVMPSPESYRTDHYEALARLPETSMLEKSIEAKNLEYRVKMADYMPVIGVGASYQYQNVLNVNHSFGSVFAMITVPISNWWEGAYEARKKMREVEMAENDVKNTKELLMLRMQKVWNELDLAYEKMRLEEEAYSIAQENYRYNRKSFDAGVLSMSELLQSHMKVVESENRWTDARIDYVLKCREYLDVTGRDRL